MQVSDFNDPAVNFENIEAITKTLLDIIPQRVFRFRPCTDYSIDAFANDAIWGTRANEFNDPMECTPYYDLAKLNEQLHTVLGEEMTAINIRNFAEGNIPPIARDIFSSAGLDTNMMAKAMSELRPSSVSNKSKEAIFPFLQQRLDSITENFWSTFFKFTNHLHVACFAENLHSTLMWSHYTDSHKGFALEYDMSTFIRPCIQECADKNSCCAFHANMQFAPVLYSDYKYDATSTLMQIAEHTLISEIYNHMPETPMPDNLYQELIKDVDRFKMQKLILTKSSDWSYEQEWRLFTYNLAEYHGKHKCMSTAPVPTAVYLGLRMSSEDREKIIEICKQKNIPCYRMLSSYLTKEFKVYPDMETPVFMPRVSEERPFSS